MSTDPRDFQFRRRQAAEYRKFIEAIAARIIERSTNTDDAEVRLLVLLVASVFRFDPALEVEADVLAEIAFRRTPPDTVCRR